MLASEIAPGVSPKKLDRLAYTFIKDHRAEPGFLGMYGFPNTLCISIDEAVVHGIPNDKPLEEGSIVSIDCGVLKSGFYGDHAYTFEVGNVDSKSRQLLKVSRESLYIGIEAFRLGNRIGDIGYSIQNYVESHGFAVVRDLVGHGLGRELHEPPEVPNYGKRGKGKLIKEGLVLAIEPMINMGDFRVKQQKDRWTIITQDRKPSAHFEHNVAILDGKPEILSTFAYIYEALGIKRDEEAHFKR
ncbi:methionine aminopeptidase [Elysia marginata]|uniref:Methionine aminopeptidase n=1 Tax=Elysia marginata TaxID=1093978 RepID=A0AAV4G801_9GAST|nr:methionine aminopeptidase [Elysia marginata]